MVRLIELPQALKRELWEDIKQNRPQLAEMLTTDPGIDQIIECFNTERDISIAIADLSPHLRSKIPSAAQYLAASGIPPTTTELAWCAAWTSD